MIDAFGRVPGAPAFSVPVRHNRVPGAQALDFLSFKEQIGWPSIRAMALSRAKNPWAMRKHRHSRQRC